MGSSKGKWCMCKDADRAELTTFGHRRIRLMCMECGGKMTETEEEQREACPRCGDSIPEPGKVEGEEPVYWKLTRVAYCSMECAIDQHMEWFERNQK